MRIKMVYDAFNRAHELQISIASLFKGAVMSRERIGALEKLGMI